MLERDLQVAQTIQQGLLPSKPPDIPGFDIAGWNKPADETVPPDVVQLTAVLLEPVTVAVNC